MFVLAPRARVRAPSPSSQSYHAILNPDEFETAPGTENHKQLVEDMKAEAEMLAALRHDNVVSFIGIACDEVLNTPKWIVVQYADDSLEGHMAKKGSVTLRELYAMIHDILAGTGFVMW